MTVDLKLPWHVECDFIYDADRKYVANCDSQEVAEAIAFAMNASVGRVTVMRSVPNAKITMHAEPPRDHSGCLGCFRSNRDCVCGGRFGVDDDGGLTKWYATIDDAWAHMGPGKRIVTR